MPLYRSILFSVELLKAHQKKEEKVRDKVLGIPTTKKMLKKKKTQTKQKYPTTLNISVFRSKKCFRCHSGFSNHLHTSWGLSSKSEPGTAAKETSTVWEEATQTSQIYLFIRSPHQSSSQGSVTKAWKTFLGNSYLAVIFQEAR